MIIRQATIADASAISLLWEQMVKEVYPKFTPNRKWWEKMMVALIESPMVQYTVVVAEQQSEIIGFIDGLVFPEPSTGKIHGVGQHFFILPEYRHSSIAGRLYGSIVGHALKKKAEVLEFFCSPENIQFWNKRGYGLMRCVMRKETQLCTTP